MIVAKSPCCWVSETFAALSRNPPVLGLAVSFAAGRLEGPNNPAVNDPVGDLGSRPSGELDADSPEVTRPSIGTSS